jgi:hypothetical protein
MVQGRQTLSKAYQSEIFFAMQEKIMTAVTVVSYIFPNVGFYLSKLGFEHCFTIIYFLQEGV